MELTIKVNQLKLSDDGTVVATMGQCDEHGNLVSGVHLCMEITGHQEDFPLGSIHYVELVPKMSLAPVA